MAPRRKFYVSIPPGAVLALFLLTIVSVAAPRAAASDVVLHTNLLHWATATPNLGADLALGRHMSLALSAGYNAFNFPNHTAADGTPANPKLHHWLARAEGRYWIRAPFRGLYLGLHALGGQYNAGGVRAIRFLRDARYEGWGVGAGIALGYRLPLGRHWGIGASVGAGWLRLGYTKYDCGSCGRRRYSRSRDLIAPTEAAITVSYRFSAGHAHDANPPVAEQSRLLPIDTTAPVNPDKSDLPEIPDSTPPPAPVRMDSAMFVFHYPVDRTEYLPDFADNAAVMGRLRALMDSVDVAEVRITGYASPEYHPDHNMDLSVGRAHSAAGALLSEGLPAPARVSVAGRGADWDGLERAIPDLRGRDSAALRPHRAALRRVYPSLRRTEVLIIYTPRQ